MLAAFGGFPLRYPHWRFGAEYDELTKGYAYGLQKIYEMVINTDPCYAYLLQANAIPRPEAGDRPRLRALRLLQEQRLVCPTNRQMLDEMANHAARVNRYCDRFGAETVEVFIDACLSLEDLIDAHAPHIRRSPAPVGRTPAARSQDRRDPVRPAVPLQGVHGLVHQSARGHRTPGQRTAAEAAGEGRQPLVPRRAGARRAVIPAWSTPRSKTGSATCWPSFATRPITSRRRARPRS